ncbi:MAG: epoxide hydrolase [Robiginitomaculum sp.]|nr:MAG: epoxide hydrolase [Robiginitomaculum sp.]
MRFPDPKIIKLNDINIATYQAGPQDGVPLLLIHGWPEIAYSWAHQIEPLAQAGYRVIAMDLRGFGNSDAPTDVHAYGIEKLVGDIEGLLDVLGIEKVVLCGHDWGGIIVWHAARMIEARVRGVISICTPHVNRPPVDPLTIFKHRHGDDHYFVAFQEPDTAEALFAQDPAAFFRMMFRTVPKGSKPSSKMYYLMPKFEEYLAAGAPELSGPVMGDEDMQVYVDAYAKSGFHGGVNLYRNTSANWEFDAGLDKNIAQPSLMISADRDLFLPPEFADQMVATVPDLERYTVEDCGHWAMWEQPDAINKTLLDWLGRRMV